MKHFKCLYSFTIFKDTFEILFQKFKSFNENRGGFTTECTEKLAF